jgi:hypothetical protein
MKREQLSPVIRTRWAALAGAVVSCAAGCGTPAAAVNPDETSIQGHLAEAAREQTAAEREAARYDPAATRIALPYVRDSSDPEHGASVVTNPTDTHLAVSEQHRQHARAHERAAEELTRFEATECEGIPRRERAACPLLAPVVAIRDLRDGVRVELAPAASTERTVAEMRCHYAFARAQGFTAEAAACPLYLRGVEIGRSADGRAIDIRGPTAALASEIRRRVRQEAVFAGEGRHL